MITVSAILRLGRQSLVRKVALATDPSSGGTIKIRRRGRRYYDMFNIDDARASTTRKGQVLIRVTPWNGQKSVDYYQSAGWTLIDEAVSV